MPTQEKTKEEKNIKDSKDTVQVESAKKSPAPRQEHKGLEPRRRNRNARRRGSRHNNRVRPEFDQKIISIRRVTRVVRGGRRFSFSVALVAGDKNGSVGVGLGKAGDTALAIEKALRHAKKNMITIKRSKTSSIEHDTQAKFASSQVVLMPAPGKGVVAGSSVRTVLELAGLRAIGAKLLTRSKNKINNARAAIKALSSLQGTTNKKS